MKKTYTLLLSMLGYYCSYSQFPIDYTNLTDSNRYNFYYNRNRILNNITDSNEDTVEEDGPYTQFKRWEWFWEQRLYPTGNFNVVGNAIRDYLNPVGVDSPLLSRGGQIPHLKSLSYPANWKSLGPFGIPNGSNGAKGAGRLQRIAFDPNIPNDSIYVASPFGGLWKSHNNSGILVFRSLQTDQFLYNVGVADVAIDPNDGDNIFIALGDGDDDYIYSIGQSVFSEIFQVNAIVYTKNITVNNLAAGLYVLTFSSDGVNGNKKIIVK